MLPCMSPAAPSTRAPTLAEIVLALEAAYGKPAPPRFTDPFDLILLENASYLVDDERRAAVFVVRLGFVREEASYDKTYRAAREAVSNELPEGYDALIAARELLRRHGQTVCTRTAPACGACTLNKRCAFFAASGGSAVTQR